MRQAAKRSKRKNKWSIISRYMNGLMAGGAFCFFSSFISQEIPDGQCQIQLYKEISADKWTEIKNFEFNGDRKKALHLDYDSYYTLKVSDLKDLNLLDHIPAQIGNEPSEKLVSISLDPSLSGRKGVENYFIELPFAFISCNTSIRNNIVVYTFLIRTKAAKATNH